MSYAYCAKCGRSLIYIDDFHAERCECRMGTLFSDQEADNIKNIEPKTNRDACSLIAHDIAIGLEAKG